MGKRRVVAVLCAAVLLLAVNARAQAAQAPDTAAQLQVLTSAVAELQKALAEARADTAALRQQLEVIRAAVEAAGKGSTNPALATLAQDVELLAAKVTDQEQTKVESGSKYHVRLSGLVLFTAAAARGAVDSLDLPLMATTATPGDSGSAITAGVRQSFLTVSVFGPTVGGARTSGSLGFDFFGGFPGTRDGVTAAHGRLRTGSVSFDWERTSITAGQEAPFFSPLNPTTVASVAYPGFSSAGNLWVWTPHVSLTHRINAGEHRSVVWQVGVLDPLTGEAPASEYARVATAGERTGRPAIAGRLAFEQTGDREQAFGVGVYQSSQNWGFERTANAWAVTADARVVASPMLEFAGEAYRGRGIASLGGGTSPAVAFNGDAALASTPLRVVASDGGWIEARFNLNPRVSLVAGAGGDRSSGDAVAWLRLSDPTMPRTNAALTGSLIIRPRSNLMVSTEYRRLLTDGVDGVARRAHVVTFAAGILF